MIPPQMMRMMSASTLDIWARPWVLFSIPRICSNHGQGRLTTINLYIAMVKSVGMDYDRKTGNLVYDHNRKMKTAKEKREPFNAPPIKRNNS